MIVHHLLPAEVVAEEVVAEVVVGERGNDKGRFRLRLFVRYFR